MGALILAAGPGTRFGSQKLLAELDGRPLLEHVIANALGSSVDRVVCVLGSDAADIAEAIDLSRVETVICEEWQHGQSASLRAGVKELIDAAAIVVLLGDEPLVSAAAIDRVIAAREPGVEAVRATYSGVASHPTVLQRELFDDLLELEGDIGARPLLSEVKWKRVPCDDCASGLDVDTKGDLEILEQAVSESPDPGTVKSC